MHGQKRSEQQLKKLGALIEKAKARNVAEYGFIVSADVLDESADMAAKTLSGQLSGQSSATAAAQAGD